MAVFQSILEITFFSFASPKKKLFLEVFRYRSIYLLYDGHHFRHARRGDYKKLIFREKIYLSKKKKKNIFPKYLLYQRFFLYVLVIFSFFYDVDAQTPATSAVR